MITSIPPVPNHATRKRMFHFAVPTYLLLALVLPLLAWRHLRLRRLAVPHPSLGLFAGLPVGRAPFARHGGLGLRLLALTLLILALAGPRWPDLRTRASTPRGLP